MRSLSSSLRVEVQGGGLGLKVGLSINLRVESLIGLGLIIGVSVCVSCWGN